MSARDSFSKRNRYAGTGKEITIREDAPEGLRFAVLESARELEWGPSSLRNIVCRVLRVRPDPDNWSEYPNVWGEVQDLVYACDWFKVYDSIEALHAAMADNDEKRGEHDAEQFAAEMNAYFVEEGIGWQLVDGQNCHARHRSVRARRQRRGQCPEGVGTPNGGKPHP